MIVIGNTVANIARFARSTDGGLNWVYTDAPAGYRSWYGSPSTLFTDENTGVTMMFQDKIVYTTDQGVTWNFTTTPLLSATHYGRVLGAAQLPLT